MSTPMPFLSVVVPAHQGEGVLPRSLEALRGSDLPRECWELIVVDDASSDTSTLVAAQYADAVVRLPGRPRGPAYARNRGFEASRGEVIVFVDADVAVHPAALRQFAALFARQPQLGAAFGSYDGHPPGEGLVSQYRNLLHHHVHHRNIGPAETFWAGCGAVRRDVFATVGMFNEWDYSRPQIEDIELGRRIRRAGWQILLRPEIQGTHLKRWTFVDMVRTDVVHRGVPWMRLLLREGRTGAAATLNLRPVEKWCTVLVGTALAALPVALVLASVWPLAVAVLALAAVVLFNLRFYRFLALRRGSRFAAGAVSLHLLYYFLNGLSAAFGWALHTWGSRPEPEDDRVAPGKLKIRIWPPPPRRPASSLWSAAAPGSRTDDVAR
jgi:glycosyltransferase involved in cell wall biosynthesis